MKRAFLFYFLIANLLFLLSNLPLFIYILKTPPGTYFPLYHPAYIPDYNGYLSAITLGKEGYFYFRNPFTTEKPTFSIFYLPYILMGKVAAVFSLSAPVTYHLSRTIIVQGYIIGIYLLSRILLNRKYALIAALAALFLTIAPPLLFGGSGWWTKYDSLARLDSPPHHLLGQTLFIFALLFLFKGLLSYASVAVFLAGVIFPPSILAAVFALPLGLVLNRFLKKAAGDGLGRTRVALFIFFALLALIIVGWQTSIGYHKSVWVDWEIERWNKSEPDFNRRLFLVLLPSILLSLPLLLKGVRSLKLEGFFVLFWAYLPLILLPFSDLLSISKIRLLGTSPFVAFGLLFSYGVQRLKKHFLIHFLFFLILTLPTTAYLLFKNIQESYDSPLYSNIYYPPSLTNSLFYVQKNVPKDSLILSNEFMGGIFPAFAPVVSYFGHINLTVDFKTKQNYTWRFFTNRMEEKEAHDFLKKNNISYVYWGSDEKGLGQNSLKYQFLTEVYRDNEVKFYKRNHATY